MGNLKANAVAAVVGHTLLWFAMFVVLAGLLFFAWGIYALLAATAIGAAVAAIIVGVGLICIVAIAALVAARIQSAPQRPGRDTPAPARTYDTTIEDTIRPVVGNRATDWAKANTGLVVLGALSAGVVLSASPRLRSLIVGASGPIVTRKAMEAVERFTQQ